MKPSKRLNTFPSKDNTLIITPLNTKPNMFLNLDMKLELNMFLNKD